MPYAPAEFSAALSLALGRNSRLAVGAPAWGGACPTAPAEPDPEAEAPAQPTEMFERASMQVRYDLVITAMR
jgi:hypothetical protein